MANENTVYHKQCCSCKSCNQKLDSGTLCNGADNEIYCKNCHSRKFGGSSFRGMASTWVDEEAASKMRPCQNIDPTKLKIINSKYSVITVNKKMGEFYTIVVEYFLTDKTSA